MIFKNSLKSIVRTPVKTLLFMLLLVAVTTFLCLGVGMWRSSDQLLAEADKTFTTTALVEYIGANYPDQGAYGEHMAEDLANYDVSCLGDSEYVMSYDESTLMGAYVEGNETSPSANHYYKNMGVLYFKIKYLTDEGYSALIAYPYFDGLKHMEGTFFNLSFPQEITEYMAVYDKKPELDHTYIANGQFSIGHNRSIIFTIMPVTLEGVPLETDAERAFAACPIIDVSGIERSKLSEMESVKRFEELGRAYQVLNNFMDVYVTNDVERISEFQRKETSLTEGRFFTPEEYANGSQVCIISELMSRQLEAGIGDTVDLNLYGAKGNAATYESFYPTSGFAHSGSYTVVGVYKEMAGMLYNVYIPRAEGAEWLPEKTLDYTLCRVRLKNGTAELYCDQMQSRLIRNMRISVFDQGYSEAAASLNAVKSTARILTIVCAVCGFAVLMLFAYLYIAKQRDNVRTMLALGTGRGNTIAYLLISVMLLALLSVVIGGAIGYLVGDEVMTKAYENAIAERTSDMRFSSMYMSGEIIEFSGRMSAELIDPAISGGAVFVVAFIMAAIFATDTISSDRSSKRAKREKAFMPSRAVFVMKLSLRSIVRNKGKSLVVPIVSLAMVCLMCSFGANLTEYQRQLNDVYENMPVRAYFTSYNGKMIDNIGINEVLTDKIVDTGFVKKANYTASGRTQYVGRTMDASGAKLTDPGYINIPVGFAFATFFESIASMEKVIFTNNIATAPAFFFEENVEFEFLNGYDASVFETNEAACLMTREMMEQNGISLGDTVRYCMFFRGEEMALEYDYLDMKVVGTYPRLQGNDSVYIPLNYGREKVPYMMSVYYYVPYGSDSTNKANWLSTPTFPYWKNEVVEALRIEAASFELQNTRELETFKDQLEKLGLSAIGKASRTRTFMVIDDQNLNDTVNSLNRHISYMNILYYAMYAVSAGIGFVVSYLLTKTRKPEFAIMRSMGAGKTRTFFTFFIEQALLCAVGTALGAAATYFMYGAVQSMQLYAILGYGGFYIVGIVIAITIMNGVNVLKIMTAKE